MYAVNKWMFPADWAWKHKQVEKKQKIFSRWCRSGGCCGRRVRCGTTEWRVVVSTRPGSRTWWGMTWISPASAQRYPVGTTSHCQNASCIRPASTGCLHTHAAHRYIGTACLVAGHINKGIFRTVQPASSFSSGRCIWSWKSCFFCWNKVHILTAQIWMYVFFCTHPFKTAHFVYSCTLENKVSLTLQSQQEQLFER